MSPADVPELTALHGLLVGLPLGAVLMLVVVAFGGAARGVPRGEEPRRSPRRTITKIGPTFARRLRLVGGVRRDHPGPRGAA